MAGSPIPSVRSSPDDCNRCHLREGARGRPHPGTPSHRCDENPVSVAVIVAVGGPLHWGRISQPHTPRQNSSFGGENLISLIPAGGRFIFPARPLTAVRRSLEDAEMERRVQHSRAWRAAFGVLVLYVLVLQSLFGGIAATRMSLQASGVICFDHLGDTAENRDGQAEHESCCSTACRLAQFALSPPEPKPITALRPVLLRERHWRVVQFHGPPTRPHGSTHPRAPPAAA